MPVFSLSDLQNFRSGIEGQANSPAAVCDAAPRRGDGNQQLGCTLQHSSQTLQMHVWELQQRPELRQRACWNLPALPACQSRERTAWHSAAQERRLVR